MRDLSSAIRENITLISLTVLSIGLTAYLAYTASSPAEAVTLAVLASACQILAGVVSVKTSNPAPGTVKVDPAFVSSALARLADITVKAQHTMVDATYAREKGNAAERREILGSIRVSMGYLLDEVKHALNDWEHLAPEIIKQVTPEPLSDATSSAKQQEVSNA